jgi:putative membrane protein
MNLLIQIIISSLAVYFTAYILPGISINSFISSIGVAIILALLNTFLKPVMILLTIPVTVITMGLFLLVINAFIIILASKIIDGFTVDGFWWALLFSIILSVVTGILEKIGENTAA